MFNPDEITGEVVSQLLHHFQWHTGALLFFAVPDVVRASAQPHPLEQSPVRDHVATLCRVVNEQPPRDEALVAEVYDITQALAEGLCSHAWGHGYDIPPAFWGTEIGQLMMQAQIWARGDKLITLSEAARILRGSVTDTSLGYINGLIRTRKLIAYIDHAEPNPQRARRVLRSEVELLAQP